MCGMNLVEHINIKFVKIMVKMQMKRMVNMHEEMESFERQMWFKEGHEELHDYLRAGH